MRGGSTTPVPKWGSSLRLPESPYQESGGGGSRKGKQVPVSARKLAATLWEMNQMDSARIKHDDLEEKRVHRDRGSLRSASYLPHHLSDPSHSPLSERLERSGNGSHYTRVSSMSQKIRHTSHKVGASNASFMEMEMPSRGQTPKSSTLGFETVLRDLSNGLTTSKELLTVLGRMWGIEEHYTSGKSIVSALRAEIKSARDKVDHLVQEQHSNHKEIYYLMKHFAEEEKAGWKKKMKERVESAVKSVSNDLEMERKLRRRTESLTKTLARELAETKATLSHVVKELENEKRARELMEKVGGELAKDIGEDRALAEQLKKESVKVREEVEKEREMLQIADVLREERVHMKLLEAKHQFEEKNAAVNKLSNELEMFLGTKESRDFQRSCPNCSGIVAAADDVIDMVSAYQNQEIGKGKGGIEDEEGYKDLLVDDASTESDLHSIELEMDNKDRNHIWNYAARTALEDQKRLSADKDSKGRRSTSGKLTKGRVSLESCTSDGIEWDFSTKNGRNWGDGYDRESYSKSEKQAHAKDYEIERQRHKSIKDLRDYIVSNARLASAHGFTSPTKQWGES